MSAADSQLYPETASASERIAELEHALKIAQEALFWHDGENFEIDGHLAGNVIKAALRQVDHD